MSDPDPATMTPVEFYRWCLAGEVRDRAPELATFADRVEALPDDDPRFAWVADGDNMLDCCTAAEFAIVIEPFLDDDARRRMAEGATFGPDVTHRFMADPATRAEVVGIVAEHLVPHNHG